MPFFTPAKPRFSQLADALAGPAIQAHSLDNMMKYHKIMSSNADNFMKGSGASPAFILFICQHQPPQTNFPPYSSCRPISSCLNWQNCTEQKPAGRSRERYKNRAAKKCTRPRTKLPDNCQYSSQQSCLCKSVKAYKRGSDHAIRQSNKQRSK